MNRENLRTHNQGNRCSRAVIVFFASLGVIAVPVPPVLHLHPQGVANKVAVTLTNDVSPLL